MGDLPVTEAGVDPAGQAAADPAADPADDRVDAETLERVIAALRAAGIDLLALARLRADRTRLHARRGLFRAMKYAWLVLAAVMATGVALTFLALGAADGLAILLGNRPWAGRVATGALGLATLAATFGLARLRVRRAEAARLRARYGDSGPDPTEGTP